MYYDHDYDIPEFDQKKYNPFYDSEFLIAFMDDSYSTENNTQIPLYRLIELRKDHLYRLYLEVKHVLERGHG